MKRADVLVECPSLDGAVFPTPRGAFRVTVADAERDLPGPDTVVVIRYDGPELGQVTLRLSDLSDLNDGYVQEKLTRFFAMDPLPVGGQYDL